MNESIAMMKSLKSISLCMQTISFVHISRSNKASDFVHTSSQLHQRNPKTTAEGQTQRTAAHMKKHVMCRSTAIVRIKRSNSMTDVCIYCKDEDNRCCGPRQLISPCLCKGTMGRVHRDCLAKCNASKCSVCKYEYRRSALWQVLFLVPARCCIMVAFGLVNVVGMALTALALTVPVWLLLNAAVDFLLCGWMSAATCWVFPRVQTFYVVSTALFVITDWSGANSSLSDHIRVNRSWWPRILTIHVVALILSACVLGEIPIHLAWGTTCQLYLMHVFLYEMHDRWNDQAILQWLHRFVPIADRRSYWTEFRKDVK